MIKVEKLTKTYHKTIAVNRVNMEVEPGKITVLLGPNGAGKSTTLKSIAGLLNFEGEISICGFKNKSRQAKQIFGYVPETRALFELLDIEEHIRLIQKAYSLGEEAIEAANYYIERLELKEHLKKPARELSKGMMQKVSICMAMMINPKAIMFDEPMIGLDPKAIENLNNIFKDLRSKGVSVLISTHIIDIMDELWDKAYIMNKGEIAIEVSKEELMNKNLSLKELFFKVTEGGLASI